MVLFGEMKLQIDVSITNIKLKSFYQMNLFTLQLSDSSYILGALKRAVWFRC